jgi:NAD(P)-dependent dehydrogenase (short-subunit alcohol dehydrogenase family)
VLDPLLDGRNRTVPPPFNNQVVLITGACGGIGRELSFQMSQKGAVIAALDLKAEPLEKLLADLKAAGGTGHWAVGDVTDRASIHAAVKEFTQKLGPVEILIANAGLGRVTPWVGFNAADFKLQVDVNLFGVVNSIEAVLPGMLERKRGQIAALSSLASYRGLPMMSGYCASKAGVSALMDSLRTELRPYGIDCTTICPGWIQTPLLVDITVPKDKVMAIPHAVRVMVRAVERRKPYVAFPPNPHWLLALNRILPTRWGDWALRMMMRRMELAEKKQLSQRPNP